jgi:hypothetical protein
MVRAPFSVRNEVSRPIGIGTIALRVVIAALRSSGAAISIGWSISQANVGIVLV